MTTAKAATPYGRDLDEASVLVVDGFGVSLIVSRGHLIVRDGMGRNRRERRLPKAQRTVRRIVILGHTGHISLEAVRWCHDTGIGFLQVEPDGAVLLTSGKPGRDDARLRRSQAAAATNPHGLLIARNLLTAKVDGQAAVLERHTISASVANSIRAISQRLAVAVDLSECRDLEAQAANLYFGAWSAHVTCTFAVRDRPKVPDHWTVFAARGSVLHRGGRSPRGAADPISPAELRLRPARG